ncbi:glycosyltransferase [Marinoscillum sp. MHG1-6]|uniref:glycosyltransferase n=1 Tax=Marinoscillum sp. MHG1-6 TaxID=2959627 RepID=UPI002157A538|nr:glycosyltransferase [Marinoscillum sp. MHG1-6]
MQPNGKNILLISPEPWDHIFVSKHHYARVLAERGNHVVFANPPKGNWKLSESEYVNLSILDYPKFMKGLRKLPSFISSRLIRNRLKKIENYCKRRFDIIWSFDNSVFFDFSLLRTYNISHIVDLNQNFETARAAGTADVCFYTTQFIGERLKTYNPNAHFIHHGYNDGGISDPIELPGEQSVKILYAGNLNMPYLDWKSLSDAISENPNADFIFVGPLADGEMMLNTTEQYFNKVRSNERVHLLGKVDADDLPGYYATADVLIICYQEEHHMDQANPHKMMEYLGTGKCIVATYTEAFSEYQDTLIEMCDRNTEFPDRLKICIQDLSRYNSAEIQQKRRQLALDNTYTRQVERIESIIGLDV